MELLNRRREMGGKSLPYDAEIEYLQSTGAYIVIPYGIDSTTNMRVEFIIGGNTAKDRFVFGSSDGWEVNMTMLGASDIYTLRCGTSGAVLVPSYYAPFNSKNIFIKNGVNISLGSYSYTSSNYSKTIERTFLFAGTSNGKSAFSAGNNVRIYSFYMSNAEYCIDLIPVRVGNVGYMYDKISKQLFGNAGTGAFVLGPDK